jgi:hypothetical protein
MKPHSALASALPIAQRYNTADFIILLHGHVRASAMHPQLLPPR